MIGEWKLRGTVRRIQWAIVSGIPSLERLANVLRGALEMSLKELPLRVEINRSFAA